MNVVPADTWRDDRTRNANANANANAANDEASPVGPGGEIDLLAYARKKLKGPEST